jgi:hypothetical protein
MDKIISFLKEMKAIIIAIVVLCAIMFLVFNFKSCSPIGKIIPGGTVVAAKTVTPTSSDWQKIPTGNTITAKVIIPKPKPNKPGIDTNTSVIVSVDPKCNTCNTSVVVVETDSIKFGFYNEPKLFVGRTVDLWTIGVEVGSLRWYRYSLNVLLTMPYFGLGLNYDITENLSLIGAANIRYLQFKQYNDISSYKFGITQPLYVEPMLGVAFAF